MANNAFKIYECYKRQKQIELAIKYLEKASVTATKDNKIVYLSHLANDLHEMGWQKDLLKVIMKFQAIDPVYDWIMKSCFDIPAMNVKWDIIMKFRDFSYFVNNLDNFRASTVLMRGVLKIIGKGHMKTNDFTEYYMAWVEEEEQKEFNSEMSSKKLEGIKKGEKQVVKFANGIIFDGFVKDGKLIGEGILNYPDKSQFVGFFENNLKHGHGVQTYPFGVEFEGEFVNG